MQECSPTVFVVDDDGSVRESLESLITCAGWQPEVFASAPEFLARPCTPGATCLVLDVDLPGMKGLDVQGLVADRKHMPVIFITGHGDVASTVRAMKAGAIEFLTKPFDVHVLIDAIRRGLERSQAILGVEQKLQALRALLRTLTPRERDVMSLITAGMLNKQVAGMLGISEITVKAHRGKAMRKMKARSFADLVRMAGDLHLVNASH
jgi:FixJ family two-component response regulator